MRANFRMPKDMQLLFTKDELETMNVKLANKLNEYYCPRCNAENPLHIVGILNGVFRFVSDVTRHLKFEFVINFIKVSSYKDTQTQSKIEFDHEEAKQYNQYEHVLLIDDLWDSGSTFLAIKAVIPKAELCTLVVKGNEGHKHVKFIGIDKVPIVWVIGYGFHFGNVGRGWPIVVYRGEV